MFLCVCVCERVDRRVRMTSFFFFLLFYIPGRQCAIAEAYFRDPLGN